jgi:hypothetical protein
MGVAQGSNGVFYVCGRYSPPGNVGGVSAWGANGGPNPGMVKCSKTESNYLVDANYFQDRQYQDIQMVSILSTVSRMASGRAASLGTPTWATMMASSLELGST